MTFLTGLVLVGWMGVVCALVWAGWRMSGQGEEQYIFAYAMNVETDSKTFKASWADSWGKGSFIIIK